VTGEHHRYAITGTDPGTSQTVGQAIRRGIEVAERDDLVFEKAEGIVAMVASPTGGKVRKHGARS